MIVDTLEKQGLRDRLRRALATAEAGDSSSVELATLRLVECAVRDRDVLARERGDCGGCDEDAVHNILQTMTEQFEESAREFDEAGRIEEAEREREAITIIEPYLPILLQGPELERAIEDVIEDLEATKLKDMGKCMSALKTLYPGRIDNGTAGKAVRAILG